MNVYEVAREAIEICLKGVGVKQANERSLKKSAYCTTYVISDGDGVVEDYNFCQHEHTWQPELTIYFHNGANRAKLHEEVSKTRYDVISALIHYGKITRPPELFQFGVPVEWEQTEIEDDKVSITIRITCISQNED